MEVKRFVVYPYKMKSEAGILVSEALDALRVYPDRAYEPRKGDFIVNWGNGVEPNWASRTGGLPVLNRWDKVDLSINKKASFRKFKEAGVQTPKWTTSSEVALDWSEDGLWVCCRQQVEGKDGEGLVLAKKPSELVGAKLYTRYIKQAKEYRVYIFRGKMIDILEKRRDSALLHEGKVDQDIRTESRGWVFCRSGVHAPADAESVAAKAISALGLDFGGVDVVQSAADGKCYVLETNTAPGVAGMTVDRLAKAIKGLAKSI